jgi:hypothetical protein
MSAFDLNLDSLCAMLRRTPATIASLLDGVPPVLASATEGNGTWSPYDVVGHLVHNERVNWMPRVRHILSGSPEAFANLDREAQFSTSRSKTLAELLGEFARLRAASVQSLMKLALTADDLGRAGRHPDLGDVTLGQLLATWSVHDLDHVAQISRVLAKAQGPATGPWQRYLSILRDREPNRSSA